MIGKLVAVLLLAAVAAEARSARNKGKKERLHVEIKCGVPPNLHPSKYYLLNPLDRCCQKHDECKIRIPPQTVDKYTGVLNPTDETIVSCECEKEFHRCLQIDNTILSQEMCEAYFKKYEKRTCVNFDYKRKPGCRVYYENDDTRMPERCLVYNYDKTKGMKWDLFDLLPCNASFPDLPDNSHILGYEPTVPTTIKPRPTLWPDVPEVIPEDIQKPQPVTSQLRKRTLEKRNVRHQPKPST